MLLFICGGMCDKMKVNRGIFIMKKEKMQMRFGGDNDIDLETLAVSLNSTVSSLKCIADKVVTENEFCRFKVENIEKGSFVITIEQIYEEAATMLAPLLPQLPTVFSTFKSILEIRKMLKGEAPKSVEKNGDKVSITTNNGTVFNADRIVFNIYTSNDNIEKNLAKTSKSVMEDNFRTGLTYQFENEEEETSIVFSKDELIPLSKPQDVESFNNIIEENEMTTYLKVRKPDLIGDSKWKMVLNGKNIDVEILDKDFLDGVHNGEINFKKGIELEAKMIIRYTEKKILSYKIIKVLKVEER